MIVSVILFIALILIIYYYYLCVLCGELLQNIWESLSGVNAKMWIEC